MSVDYSVNMICGIKVNIKDLKKVISPASWEEQPRYDTRTGQITHMEKVLVKEECSEYVFGEFKHEDWDELIYDITRQLKLKCTYNCEYTEAIIGEEIFQKVHYGNLCCPNGEASLQKITEAFEKMKSLFPDNEINLHSIGNVSY